MDIAQGAKEREPGATTAMPICQRCQVVFCRTQRHITLERTGAKSFCSICNSFDDSNNKAKHLLFLPKAPSSHAEKLESTSLFLFLRALCFHSFRND